MSLEGYIGQLGSEVCACTIITRISLIADSMEQKKSDNWADLGLFCFIDEVQLSPSRILVVPN